MLKLYGHFGSQPTRSVAWLLKMKKAPFEFITINPTSGETRTPDYRKKFPLGLIPALEDTDSIISSSSISTVASPLTISEASAIMIYLCEKYGWEDFYPTNLHTRAKIHEYISHHNESARMMTRKVIFPTTKWMFSEGAQAGMPSRDDSIITSHLSHSARDIEKVKVTIRDISKRFQHKFLAANKNSSYIGGIGESPTIADLLAYPELAQIPQIMGIDYSKEWGEGEFDLLKAWMDKMEELPYHDDIHRTVFKIGKLYKSKL